MVDNFESFLEYQFITIARGGFLPISSLMKSVNPKSVRGPRYGTLWFEDLNRAILGSSKSNINRLPPVIIYEMICIMKTQIFRRATWMFI